MPVIKIPESMENLLWCVVARNDWQQPELALADDCLTAKMASGITIAFQTDPADDTKVLVQPYTAAGQPLRVHSVPSDAYDYMETILNVSHHFK